MKLLKIVIVFSFFVFVLPQLATSSVLAQIEIDCAGDARDQRNAAFLEATQCSQDCTYNNYYDKAATGTYVDGCDSA